MRTRRRKAKRYYLIIDKKKRNYGAFPRTKEGKVLALGHIKRLKESSLAKDFKLV